MPKYLITATVKETYIASQEVEVEIEAASEEEACRAAHRACEKASTLSSWHADHEETDVEIESIEITQGAEEDEDAPIPRCKNTLDMFSGLAA